MTNAMERKIRNWKLKTGDLLLFSGISVTSRLVRMFTGSCLSHAALVWVCPITFTVYVFETGSFDRHHCVPMITRRGAPINGARLLPLFIKLRQSHNAKMYVRRLKIEKKEDGTLVHDPIKVELGFDAFVARNLGTPYTTNLVNLWLQRGSPLLVTLPFLQDDDAAHLSSKDVNADGSLKMFPDDREEHHLMTDDCTGMFTGKEWMCSQMAVIAYWRLGILMPPIDADTSCITPGDLYSDILTTPGYSFGQPELLFTRRRKAGEGKQQTTT